MAAESKTGCFLNFPKKSFVESKTFCWYTKIE
mgnify:FL=1